MAFLYKSVLNGAVISRKHRSYRFFIPARVIMEVIKTYIGFEIAPRAREQEFGSSVVRSCLGRRSTVYRRTTWGTADWNTGVVGVE